MRKETGMIEIRELQYLVVCADTHSFSRAAKVLYTSQSNVSKVIRSLEDKLGFDVFVRESRGIRLTGRGRQAYEYAERILEEERQMSTLYQMDRRKEFSFSFNPSSWIAQCFADFYKGHGDPDMRYGAIEGSVNTVLERVGSGLDEIGFIFFLKRQEFRITYHLERSGLIFDELRTLRPFLYQGKGKTGRQDKSNRVASQASGVRTADPFGRPEGRRLVQCYEDEFALNHFWETIRGPIEKTYGNQVAVLTNSDYVMTRMLAGTDLCNISGEDLGGGGQFGGVPFDEERSVLFGYVKREKEPFSETAQAFLEFVRERLSGMR